VLRRQGLAFIRSSLLQLKLHCPWITIEDVRNSDLLAELTNVLSDGFLRFVAIICRQMHGTNVKIIFCVKGFLKFSIFRKRTATYSVIQNSSCHILSPHHTKRFRYSMCVGLVILISHVKITYKRDMPFGINVTMRRVPATIVAVEKQ